MAAHARVALVTTYYHPVLGGAEAAARRLAAFLVRRGHDVSTARSSLLNSITAATEPGMTKILPHRNRINASTH